MICGSTGGGKSVLKQALTNSIYLQNNSIHTMENFDPGYNVLYFSLEMPLQQCVFRSFASMADVPFYGIRDTSLNRSEMQSLKQLTEFIKNYPYHYEIIDIPRGCTMDDIEECYKQTCDVFIPDVVFIDYLGLMEERNFNGDDWLKLGYIAGRMHEFARKYNVPVVTSTQLNRNNKASEEDTIGIHRIGRSSLITHHATCVIQIESRVEESTYSDLSLHLIKNRNGALGHFNLNKNLAHCRITDPEMVLLPDTSLRTYNPIDKSDISTMLESYGWSV